MGLIADHRMTNREKAQSDPAFLKACEISGVYPSKNNYRKFKWKRGNAYLAWSKLTEAEKFQLLADDSIDIAAAF